MKVAVMGTGYVGLVTGACLADLGHAVVCVDAVPEKVQRLRSGEVPIYEPGLEEIVRRNASAGRLSFTSDPYEAVPGAEVVFIAVGTPSAPDGSVDMSAVDAVAEAIGRSLTGYAVIANKSTVPIGTSERVAGIIRQVSAHTFDVVSNPEFLREGHAVYDFLHPSRVVIGSSTSSATDAMVHLYAYLDCPKVVMDPRSAEMCKYASNAFLAVKISFANEIAHLCESVGADVEKVTKAMGLDGRIGKEFLKAGLGWGGSCFPKDVLAIKKLGDAMGHPMPLVTASMEMNRRARTRVADRIAEKLGNALEGKKVAVLGIAFKNNTDDTRESPAIDLIRSLETSGATVVAHDPVARLEERHGTRAEQVDDIFEAAQDADAVAIATEWEAFRAIDLPKLKAVMRGDVLADARNLLDRSVAEAVGFRVIQVGR